MKRTSCLATFVVILALGLVTPEPLGATPIVFTATLSGLAEAPPNPSAGTGEATVTFDTILHQLFLETTFSGLTGTTTVAHIHVTTTAFTGTGGVAVTPGTLPGFPVGVTSGVYATSLDLTDAATYTAAFRNGFGGSAAGAEQALLAALIEGRAYFNIHTAPLYPGGEIRGFFVPQEVPTAVPEPASLTLLGFGLAGIAGRRWRQRRTS